MMGLVRIKQLRNVQQHESILCFMSEEHDPKMLFALGQVANGGQAILLLCDHVEKTL